MKKLIRDGIALAYEEAGSGLPPMLLVHCWCCDHGYMTPQFEHFARGHRVISVDLRGHGESDKPRQEYTPAGFADDLAWLCGQLRVEKPVVVGHSMGGNVAFELARRRPDLPAAIVAVDSAIIPALWVIDAVKQHMGTLRGSGYQEGQKAWVSGFFLPTDDNQLKAEILEGMSSLPPYVMISALDHHILSWDGAGAAAACKLPALLIVAATPLADLERMRQLCPQLVVGQTVGVGHFNNRVVPEQVNAMIERFLATSVEAPTPREYRKIKLDSYLFLGNATVPTNLSHSSQHFRKPFSTHFRSQNPRPKHPEKPATQPRRIRDLP